MLISSVLYCPSNSQHPRNRVLHVSSPKARHFTLCKSFPQIVDFPQIRWLTLKFSFLRTTPQNVIPSPRRLTRSESWLSPLLKEGNWREF